MDRSSPPENLYRGVEETPAQKIAPSEKRSTFWSLYERIGYKSPHFNCLFDIDEDLREWIAIGMINAFDELLEEVKSLQLDVSSDKLSSLSRSLAKHEKYGFDVAKPRSLICKVLFLQGELAKKADKMKSLGATIKIYEMVRQKVEEIMAELERKSMELKRQEMVAKEKKDAVEKRMVEMKEKKDAVDKRLVEMKSLAETIDQETEEIVIEFDATVSDVW